MAISKEITLQRDGFITCSSCSGSSKVKLAFNRLNGVNYGLFHVSEDSFSERELLLKVKEIKEGILAFISVYSNDRDYKNIVNKIITNNSDVKIIFNSNFSLNIEITTFDEWFDNQEMFSNTCNYEEMSKKKFYIDTADVKVLIGEGSSQETLRAHSISLATKSTYFEALFSSDMLESNSKTFEPKTSKVSMFTILQFIYTNKLDKSLLVKKNYSIILELYFKVQEFQLDELKFPLQVLILGFLDEDNLNLLKKSNILIQDDPFSIEAMKFIVNNFGTK